MSSNNEQRTETKGSDVLDMKQIISMVGVSPRVIYAAFKDGDLAGRNLGGRKGWVTTRNCVLDWIESGNESEDIS